jgi:hypothetical protein
MLTIDNDTWYILKAKVSEALILAPGYILQQEDATRHWIRPATQAELILYLPNPKPDGQNRIPIVIIDGGKGPTPF